MIQGIGLDIEQILRFREKQNDKNFLSFVFNKSEIEYCSKKADPAMSFAGKFCAKEAVIKAYPKKISIKDIEIYNLTSGKIRVLIKGKEDNKIHCSISHTKDTAIAFAIVEK